MHDRSHAVMRLPVQQRITFEEGHEDEALLMAQTNKTKLECWFELKLNTTDVDARQYFYTNIPYHYVNVRGKWQKSQRGGQKIVARVYTVSVKDEERFYLYACFFFMYTRYYKLRIITNGR